MKKFLCICLIVVVLASTLISAVCLPANAETQNASVTVKIITDKKAGLCSQIMFYFAKVTSLDMSVSQIISYDVYTYYSYKGNVVIEDVEPGYYAIIYCAGMNTLDYVVGDTAAFEVKGDKVTVYCSCSENNTPIPMPTEWVVYGEDTQTYKDWASNTVEALSTYEDGSYVTYLVGGGSDTTRTPETTDVPEDNDTQSINTTSPETSVNAEETTAVNEPNGLFTPGKLVVYGILLIAIIATGVVMFVRKKNLSE